MAELVDALGSGPSGGNTVEVRVLFWAPDCILQDRALQRTHCLPGMLHPSRRLTITVFNPLHLLPVPSFSVRNFVVAYLRKQDKG